MRRLFWAFLAAALLTGPSVAAERTIVVASTTSTQNSGLFDHILPIFTSATGVEVRVVAKGTGQAIRIARNGDADVLLVHDRVAEETFVADGHGVRRFDVMYNDFVIVGPASDPAGVAGKKDAAAALRSISNRRPVFVSRGDDSGTHRAERRLWQAAEVDPTLASGTWYREAGAGMGATLNTASGMNAYALTDRGTWIAFRNKGDLKVLVEGDRRLFNPYGVIAVNADRHPHVNADDASRFVAWLVSPAGQRAIASFRVGGQQLFYPNAVPTN